MERNPSHVSFTVSPRETSSPIVSARKHKHVTNDDYEEQRVLKKAPAKKVINIMKTYT